MAANYRTTITSVPPVAGLRVEVVENGSRLRLAWSGPGTVVVLDEGGAPFLRLSPSGVQTNQDSPLTYTSRDRRGLTTVPPGVDGLGAPRWVQVSEDPEVLWHEHRAHWTKLTEPPGSGEREVRTWTLPMLVNGAAMTVTGTLTFVPGPSPLPYVAVIVLAALIAAAAVRAGRWGALACLVVLAADVLRTLGSGLSVADGHLSALASAIGVAGVGWVLLVLAAVGIWRRRAGAVVLASVGGALVALSGALPAAEVLSASLPLTVWPATVQRSAVALSLGAGLGLLLGLIAAFRQLSAQSLSAQSVSAQSVSAQSEAAASPAGTPTAGTDAARTPA